MKKLLIICGPTATGKTSISIKLAKKYNGEIVSADSRQVYKMMDIGTGKDITKGSKIKYDLSKKFGYYEIDGVKVWGYDLVGPKDSFSVAQYLTFAKKVIDEITKRKKLPILVGGTGLYIKGVVDGISTATVPVNKQLRDNLDEKTAGELFEILSQIDSIKSASLNSSDRKNPRRLIRAIEVATWNLDNSKHETKKTKEIKFNTLFVGLNLDKDELSERINKRVSQRIKDGIVKEVEKLISYNVSWDDQSMTSLGYGHWKALVEREKSLDSVVEEWKNEEKKYAKRQMVWFKKDKRITWFDVLGANYQNNIDKLIERWYKQA